MTNHLLLNGDYVPDGHGGIQRVSEERGLLSEALFRLTCRRGSFPLLPELGSRLWRLPEEKPSARNMAARQYAAEALEGMALTVEDAAVTMADSGTARVRLSLRSDTQTYSLEVEV